MLTENGSGMVMPVGPMYGNGGGSFGGWGDGSFWIGQIPNTSEKSSWMKSHGSEAVTRPGN